MSDAYRFGHIEVKSAARQLLISGHPASLGSRAFDVLTALIERRDRVVTKNELLDLVWPGLVVELANAAMPGTISTPASSDATATPLRLALRE
jgi:DNA-binding winged helix-turn-helix (wHTH) protein